MWQKDIKNKNMKLDEEQKENIELKSFIEDNLFIIMQLDKKIESVENFYIDQFEALEKDIKERLILDNEIPTKDLKRVYLEELENAKIELAARALDKFKDIKEEFISTL